YHPPTLFPSRPSAPTPVHTAQAAEVPVGVDQVLVAAGVLDRAGGGGVVAATEPEDAVLPLVGLAQRAGHAGETAAFDGDRDGLVAVPAGLPAHHQLVGHDPVTVDLAHGDHVPGRGLRDHVHVAPWLQRGCPYWGPP